MTSSTLVANYVCISNYANSSLYAALEKQGIFCVHK